MLRFLTTLAAAAAVSLQATEAAAVSLSASEATTMDAIEQSSVEEGKGICKQLAKNKPYFSASTYRYYLKFYKCK